MDFNKAEFKLAKVSWGHAIDGIIATEQIDEGIEMRYYQMEFDFAEFIISKLNYELNKKTK